MSEHKYGFRGMMVSDVRMQERAERQQQLEQAQQRVIEAAKAYKDADGWSYATHHALLDAVEALEALERP